jgi:hypothetical protein
MRSPHYPIEIVSVGSTGGCVSEDMLEGAEMSLQQVIKEIGLRREDSAYSNGWEDGRFGSTELFLENCNLARWAGHQERLAYYRGHRDGRRVREMLGHRDSA